MRRKLVKYWLKQACFHLQEQIIGSLTLEPHNTCASIKMLLLMYNVTPKFFLDTQLRSKQKAKNTL